MEFEWEEMMSYFLFGSRDCVGKLYIYIYIYIYIKASFFWILEIKSPQSDYDLFTYDLPT